VRRTAIVRRACGAPVVASGRDTEVGSQGTGNGLRRKVRITDETASVPAYTLGVITGGPRAVGRGSISEKPKQDRSLCCCAGLPSHPGEPTLSGLSMSDGTAVCPDANRAVRVPSHTDRRHNSSTLTRVAARSAARRGGHTMWHAQGASRTDDEDAASPSRGVPGPQLTRVVPTRQPPISSFPVS
jgi:hypothetical protein